VSVTSAAQSGREARRTCREETAIFRLSLEEGVRREENTKLKRLVAELSLDKVMRQDVAQEEF
jgi:hypothetical protein